MAWAATLLLSVPPLGRLSAPLPGEAVVRSAAGSPVAGTLQVVLYGSSSLALGSTDELHANASGGVAPYRFNWSVPGNNLTTGSNAYLAFTPTSDAIYDVNVYVNDSTNQSTAAAHLFVDVTGPSPISVSLRASSQSTNFVRLTAVASGGLAPYNYSWHGPGLNSSWTRLDTMSLSNLSAGTYQISVQARDARGFSGTGSLTVVSQGPAPPSSLLPYVYVGVGLGVGAAVGLGLLWLRARRRGRFRNLTNPEPPNVGP
ncbi:MAG: PKD domain-containing protein [Thermoplasmata archaeon]|nr:PKD domain-containing protein [Thermoplasmata archaeon]